MPTCSYSGSSTLHDAYLFPPLFSEMFWFILYLMSKLCFNLDLYALTGYLDWLPQYNRFANNWLPNLRLIGWSTYYKTKVRHAHLAVTVIPACTFLILRHVEAHSRNCLQACWRVGAPSWKLSLLYSFPGSWAHLSNASNFKWFHHFWEL